MTVQIHQNPYKKVHRANAHSYLTSVLKDSRYFQNKAVLLRQKYELKEFMVEPDGMSDLARTRWLDGKIAFDLTQDEDFIELCEHFYIPRNLWSGVSGVIVRNNPDWFLRSEISFTISGGGKPSKPPKLNVPHVLMAIPYDSKGIDIDLIKKNLKKIQSMTKSRFFGGVKIWKDGETFDTALDAFSCMEQGLSGDALFRELITMGHKHVGVFDPSRSDHFQWKKDISLQINSLKKYAKAFEMN